MAAPPIWHGTQTEGLELQEAIQNNCACEFSSTDGQLVSQCAAHAMFMRDQRVMDGLVFMRRMADCLKRREFDAGA